VLQGNLEQRTERTSAGEADPEEWYHDGSVVAYCGKEEVALRMLRRSLNVEERSVAGHASYPRSANDRCQELSNRFLSDTTN
jgi:hypothetical protein